MSKKKYIVKNPVDIGDLSKRFIINFSENLTDDRFDKNFLSFINKYDIWIKENGFLVWKKLVDKLKINNYESASKSFFTSIYSSASTKLFFIYKYYRLKYQTEFQAKNKSIVIKEFNSAIASNIFLYNEFDLIYELFEYDLASDLKGNNKSKLSNDKYKFILWISFIEYISNSLNGVLIKIPISKLIEFTQNDGCLAEYKIKDFGSKFYNDYKNRNQKDWLGTYKQLQSHSKLSFYQESFFRFIKKKYPQYLKNEKLNNIPVFLFNDNTANRMDPPSSKQNII